ncbi:unnamed protein product [Nippostrongylus brasiliensis]|uniref:CCHC-type domain-containing protein n=1 Tax=Nippostrongylus brasiliensis TaxID=27835 RepID=A0A0N4XVL8_NIPBR|nr:unnamed protein product [Nippostrongylus brasiliensis]
MVFVGGLVSLDTKKRLLEKEELSSKEAQQAEAIERVRQRAGHTLSRNMGSKPDKGSAREKMKCWVCDEPGHAGYECFRKEKAFCKVCKKSEDPLRKSSWCESAEDLEPGAEPEIEEDREVDRTEESVMMRAAACQRLEIGHVRPMIDVK